MIRVSTLSLVVLLVTSLFAGSAFAQEGAPADTPNAGFSKGFFIQSDDGKNKLTIGVRGMSRLTAEQEDMDADDSEMQTAFSVQELRVTFKGNVYSKNLKYKFHLAWEKGFTQLKDAVMEYVVDKNWLTVRAGQFKKPFSRQQLNSSGKLELVNRAITDKIFHAGRDLGLMLHNGSKGNIEWALGILNGTGYGTKFSGTTTIDPATNEGSVSGKFSNIPSSWKPTLAARVGYNHNGIDGYSEADFAGGPFRFAVGASAQMELDADDDEQTMMATEIDAIAKVSGLSVSGAFYYMMESDESVDPAAEVTTLGAHAQVGYLIAEMFQPAARFGWASWDDGEEATDDPTQMEIGGGLSVYFKKHNVKWQTDAYQITTSVADADINDLLIHTQVTLDF